MVKTTIYLPDQDVAALRRMAAETGRSQAEIIREAVRKQAATLGPRTLRSKGVGRGTGEPVGRRAREILRQEFGQSQR